MSATPEQIAAELEELVKSLCHETSIGWDYKDDLRAAAALIRAQAKRVRVLEEALEEAQSHFASISARVDRENRMIDEEHIDPAWRAVSSLAWDGLEITKTALSVKP